MLEWGAMQMAMNTTADAVAAAALVADVDAVDDAAAAEPLVAATHSHLRSPIQNQSWRPPYAQIREAEEELQKLKSLQDPRQIWNGSASQWFISNMREQAYLLLPTACGLSPTDATVVEVVVVVVVQELDRPAAGNAPPPIPPPTPNLAGGATVNVEEDFSEEAAIEFDAAAGCEDEAALEFAAASEDADTTTPLQTN
jgi:hypothetical protein